MIDADEHWTADSVSFKTNKSAVVHDFFTKKFHAIDDVPAVANTFNGVTVPTSGTVYSSVTGINEAPFTSFKIMLADAKGDYLRVAPDDVIGERVHYNDLLFPMVVENAPYQRLQWSKVADITENTDSIKTDTQYLASGFPVGDAKLVKETPGNANGYGTDALMARYHWRVSYYPSEDSLVFEPLNASQLGYEDVENGLLWQNSRLASLNPSIDSTNWAKFKTWNYSFNKLYYAQHQGDVGTADKEVINYEFSGTNTNHRWYLIPYTSWTNTDSLKEYYKYQTADGNLDPDGIAEEKVFPADYKSNYYFDVYPDVNTLPADSAKHMYTDGAHFLYNTVTRGNAHYDGVAGNYIDHYGSYSVASNEYKYIESSQGYESNDKGGTTFNDLYMNSEGYDKFYTYSASYIYFGLTNYPVGKAPGVPVAFTVTTDGTDDILTVGTPYNNVISLDRSMKDQSYSDDYNYTNNDDYDNSAEYIGLTYDKKATKLNADHTVASENIIPLQANMRIRIDFDNHYTYLKRATLADGLYFINLVTTKSSLKRNDGMYIVANHRGNLMYDSPTTYQNYLHMPATQWVVKQDTCNIGADQTPTIAIYNREYGRDAKGNLRPFFEGQLYTDGANYYVMNHSKYQYTTNDNRGMFVFNTDMANYPQAGYASEARKGEPSVWYSCNDTLKFTPIADSTAVLDEFNGYKHLDPKTISVKEYYMQYLTSNTYENPSLINYLNATKDSLLAVNISPDLKFQATPIGSENTYGAISSTFRTNAGITPLVRQAYILKVRDANLIDNDWKYVVLKKDVVNKNPYYAIEHLANVDGDNVKLAEFYMKNDQFYGAEDAFALVDIPGYESTGKLGENWLNESVTKSLSGTNVDEAFPWAGRIFAKNGWYRIGIEDQNALANIESLDNLPGDRVSAFILANDARYLYKPLPGGSLFDQNIKIYRERGIDGGTKEYLFEDGNNAANIQGTNTYIKGFGYLGLTGEKIAPQGNKSVALYVDSVIVSQAMMPQYLFFVNRTKVEDGLWCSTGEHGYNASGDSKTHQVFYNGYSAGRVLVNLNDSVTKYNNTSVNKLENAKLYTSENYTRLGFVEAIHMYIKDSIAAAKSAFKTAALLNHGEYLIVLNNVKLADLTSKYGVVDPTLLDKAITAGNAKVNVLDGTHKNYAFSLRYTDDNHEDFLLESQSIKGYATYGTFNKASWVKIQNNVPVLAQETNWNGDHTAIGNATTLQEVVNQSQIFKLTSTDEVATANESLAAAAVKVIAGTGSVTVKNAAGKKVVIVDMLGKIVANAQITSDAVTFEAPAGVVAVSVEGEPVVKAIVK